MQLQNINIFSTGGFIFFLLIILVGYLWVEIIFWKDYIFRNIFDKYKNSLFDRMIHYIIWWFMINLTIFIFFSYISWTEYFKIFEISWNLATALEPIIWKENTLNTQFIVISIYQFLLIFCIWIIIWFVKKWLNLFGTYIYSNQNKKVKKKTFFQKLMKKVKNKINKKY